MWDPKYNVNFTVSFTFIEAPSAPQVTFVPNFKVMHFFKDLSIVVGSAGVKKWPSVNSKVRRRNRSWAVSSPGRSQRQSGWWVRTHSAFTSAVSPFLSFDFIHRSFSAPLVSLLALSWAPHFQNIYHLGLKKCVLVLLFWIGLVLFFFFPLSFGLNVSQCPFARRSRGAMVHLS